MFVETVAISLRQDAGGPLSVAFSPQVSSDLGSAAYPRGAVPVA